MGSFIRGHMWYDDGTYYNWEAGANRNNAYYNHGDEHTRLNRTEGYEVLYFINHLADNYCKQANLATYQKIERMLRYDVPTNLKAHKKIALWITENWHNN